MANNRFSEILDERRLKYKYDFVDLCILPDNIPDFSSIGLYDDLVFKQEPENSYDNKAVAVYHNYKKIGYLYKGKMQDMANDFIARGDKVTGFISGIHAPSGKIKMHVAFYKKIPILGKFKLTGCKNEEIQSNLIGCYEGDKISVEYDDYAESYTVLNDCGECIGKLPKTAASKLEEQEDLEGFICAIEEKETDTDSYYVPTVAIFKK